METDAQPGAEGAGVGAEAQAEPTSTEGLSNAEAKDLKWVQELKARAARADKLEREIADRDAAAKKAEEDAAIAKATAEQDWKKASELKDEQYQKEIDKLKRLNTTSELKAKLASKDFSERGIDLLATEYNAETHGEITDYVKAVVENEENKVLLKSSAARTALDPMGKLPASATSSVLNNEQIKALVNGDKREDRAKGLKYLEDYYDKHGGLPPGYK
jgi:hypothetical protein